MSARELLGIEALFARFGRITALNGVSIHVNEGEAVALIGPNGAGKSTLLSCVAGLVRPSGGEIRFAGAKSNRRRLEETVRSGIAYVPENRRVFGSLTVQENLEIGAAIRRDKAAVHKEIEDFLEMFPNLADRRHELAGRLSGGEQQMLVIARAVLSKPRFLMLDEPSLGLAPMIVNRVYDLLAELRKTGLTILVIEQNSGRALGFADRTYVINSGQIRLEGPSHELADAAGFEAAYFGYGD